MGYDMKERPIDEPWKVDNSTTGSVNCHLLRVRGFNEIMVKLKDRSWAYRVEVKVVSEPWRANGWLYTQVGVVAVIIALVLTFRFCRRHDYCGISLEKCCKKKETEEEPNEELQDSFGSKNPYL